MKPLLNLQQSVSDPQIQTLLLLPVVPLNGAASWSSSGLTVSPDPSWSNRVGHSHRQSKTAAPLMCLCCISHYNVTIMSPPLVLSVCDAASFCVFVFFLLLFRTLHSVYVSDAMRTLSFVCLETTEISAGGTRPCYMMITESLIKGNICKYLGENQTLCIQGGVKRRNYRVWLTDSGWDDSQGGGAETLALCAVLTLILLFFRQRFDSRCPPVFTVSYSPF